MLKLKQNHHPVLSTEAFILPIRGCDRNHRGTASWRLVTDNWIK